MTCYTVSLTVADLNDNNRLFVLSLLCLDSNCELLSISRNKAKKRKAEPILSRWRRRKKPASPFFFCAPVRACPRLLPTVAEKRVEFLLTLRKISATRKDELTAQDKRKPRATQFCLKIFAREEADTEARRNN